MRPITVGRRQRAVGSVKCLLSAFCLLLTAYWYWRAPCAEAATSAEEPAFNEAEYTKAVEQGVEAFRRGELSQAARSFQDAYLIQPTDPKLLSWLAIVRDEQARRQAMTHTLRDIQEAGRRVDQQRAEGTRQPLLEQLAGGAFTPVEESRPEILEAGKRAGFQRLYKEGIGFQPFRGFGVSARTEIFEEPNPVDDFVLEAKILNLDEIGEFRRSILPLFTRSWAIRSVVDYQPLPRFTYEFDDRTILHELETRFAVKDRHLETHAINALYTFEDVPVLGDVTVNPWYKRVLQDAELDVGSFEHKDELIFNLSVQPSPNVEYFFQYDTLDADKTRTAGGSKLQLFKGQVRLRFPSLKLFAIPSYEHSSTSFDPGDDEFIKHDLFVDWGFDVTKRLRASSKERMVLTELTRAGSIPSNPTAETYSTENTLSYELFKDFDVSLGVDYARAAGLNAYNNVGLRAEMELFKPGIIRSKFGYEFVNYYNIDDALHLLFWRLFLFQ